MTIEKKRLHESLMERYRRKPTRERGKIRPKRRARRGLVLPERPPSLRKDEVLAVEEVLVVDDRAHLRPAQIVEGKLTRLLEYASIPVSHLSMRGLLRAR
jgi:hypothetical protein